MRLPLILGARPQFSSKGPTVMVPEGSWRVVSEGVKDSKLKLELTFAHDLLQSFEFNGVDKEHSFVGPCRAQVSFANRGNEDFVSVFAEPK